VGGGDQALVYSRSTSFDAEVTKSHVVVARADVLLDNNWVFTLDITDGNVTVSDEAIRRRCNFRLQDPTGSLVPADFGDLLTPGNSEVKLYRGVQYASGTQELMPLGVFGISRFRLDDSGATMSVQCDGFDRARRVQRSVLPKDYVITKQNNYVTAVQALLKQRYADILFGSVATTTLTTPSNAIVLEAGKDPWGEARRLLGNIGYETFFDADGFCVIQSVETPSQSADMLLTEGQNANILSLTKTLSDEQFFNHSVVVGENSSNTAPARGEAYDNDPSSPTYIGGPMGDVVDFYTTSSVSTSSQAYSVARARLKKSSGIPIIVETQDLVNPALDIDDALQIIRLRSKISDIYTVSKISIPLTFQRSMNVATRLRVLSV
jgi:hypothetical protein